MNFQSKHMRNTPYQTSSHPTVMWISFIFKQITHQTSLKEMVVSDTLIGNGSAPTDNNIGKILFHLLQIKSTSIVSIYFYFHFILFYIWFDKVYSTKQLYACCGFLYKLCWLHRKKWTLTENLCCLWTCQSFEFSQFLWKIQSKTKQNKINFRVNNDTKIE